MAVRSFEEQVRAELGALRFTPNEQVWLHVEAALQKEKKRRWLIWIFAGLLAGSALGFYYYYKPERSALESFIPIDKNSSLPVTPNKQDAHDQQHLNNAAEPGSMQQASTPALITAIKEPRQPSVSNRIDQAHNKTEGEIAAGDRKKGSVRKPDTQLNAGQNTAEQKKSDLTADASRYQSSAVTPSPASGLVAAPPVSNSVKNNDPTQSTDSSVSIIPATKEPLTRTDTSTATSFVAPQITATKKYPWRLFGTIDIGSSSETMPPNFNKADYLNVAAPPLNGPPGNSFPGSSGSFSYSNGAAYKAPTRSAGFSFGLGLQVVKQVGKHSDIGLGIAYQRYQTGITVGRKMPDSTGLYSANNNQGYYYQSSDSVRYANNWHFASFTFDYYQRINMGGSTVLRWRIGLGADVLLGSNALYFDESSRSLYEKRALRNQLQFNMSTGLDLLFGKHQDFYLGPQFTYFLTPSSAGSDYRFMRAALRAGFVIPKRKK